MQTIDALPGTVRTSLIHIFGHGLDGEDRFVVERFKTMLDGDIRAVQPEQPGAKGRREAKRIVVSRKQVEAMRPAREKIIVCGPKCLAKCPANCLAWRSAKHHATSRECPPNPAIREHRFLLVPGEVR